MLFSEKQKFTQWWVWLLLAFVTLLCTWVAIQQLVFKIPVGDKPMPNEALVVLCMAPLIPVFLISSIRLETEIDQTGVYYRFKPFHLKKHFLAWEEIESAYQREYKPISEYGGWGIKNSFRNGKAYNVSGNRGLQLVLKNGKKILVGTQKPEELEYALEQVNRLRK